MSCEELRRVVRRAEKRREDMRWDGVGWDEMRWKMLSRHNVRWDEMGWDGMTQTAVTMECNEQLKGKLRCDEIGWNRKNPHSKDMAPEWHITRLPLQSTEGPPAPYRHSLVPLYRLWDLWAFHFWNFRPRLARALLVWFWIAVWCVLCLIPHWGIKQKWLVAQNFPHAMPRRTVLTAFSRVTALSEAGQDFSHHFLTRSVLLPEIVGATGLGPPWWTLVG